MEVCDRITGGVVAGCQYRCDRGVVFQDGDEPGESPNVAELDFWASDCGEFEKSTFFGIGEVEKGVGPKEARREF